VGNVVEGSEEVFWYDARVGSAPFSDRFDINRLVGVNFNDRGIRTVYTGIWQYLDSIKLTIVPIHRLVSRN